jgi:hypothetical protein
MSALGYFFCLISLDMKDQGIKERGAVIVSAICALNHLGKCCKVFGRVQSTFADMMSATMVIRRREDENTRAVLLAGY